MSLVSIGKWGSMWWHRKGGKRYLRNKSRRKIHRNILRACLSAWKLKTENNDTPLKVSPCLKKIYIYCLTQIWIDLQHNVEGKKQSAEQCTQYNTICIILKKEKIISKCICWYMHKISLGYTRYWWRMSLESKIS